MQIAKYNSHWKTIAGKLPKTILKINEGPTNKE